MDPQARLGESLELYEKWQKAEEDYRAIVLVGSEEEISDALEVAIAAYTAYQASRQPGERAEL